MASTSASAVASSRACLLTKNRRSRPPLRRDWFTPGQSKHPVFGKLVDKASFDVAVAISKVKTRNDNPIQPIKMISVTIEMGSEGDFIASNTFAGMKPGYKFTSGPNGLGYYKDDGSATTAVAGVPTTFDPNDPEIKRLAGGHNPTDFSGSTCCLIS